MKEKQSIPFAPHLVESMRSLGYSFKTAIADLIDNSISANAKEINMYMLPNDDPYLILFDDGCGMDREELEEALRYGSKSPLEKRDENDLGRFGLGLKSASLSQCRKLIVASKKENNISAFSWDLDYIIKKKGWTLLEYESNEIINLPKIDLFNNVETGTYILLQNFDRVSLSTSNLNNTMSRYMNDTIDHLSLVFHRFLNDNLIIKVNDIEIEGKDPFLKDHIATQKMREQILNIENSNIIIKPFVLPYINKLTKEDFKKVGGKEDLKNNQGFYIYRNKRLILWGTWFRLTRKEELSKLARIMVDIPSDLDYMWGIDIKKSSANLPDKIKKNLFTSLDNSIFKSKNVHEYRGRKSNKNNDINYIWEKIELREGEYEYKINKDIPQIKLLGESLNQKQYSLLNNILNNIEKSFPVSSLYIDVSKGNIKDEKDYNEDIEVLYQELIKQLEYSENIGIDEKSMLKILLDTEPYCHYKNLKDRFYNLEKDEN